MFPKFLSIQQHEKHLSALKLYFATLPIMKEERGFDEFLLPGPHTK